MFPTLPAALAHHAETIPDQLFTRVLKGGNEIAAHTFAEMWTYATQWAALFTERGLRHGEAVILALPNTHEFVGAYYGCLIAGLAPAPLAPLRRIAEDDPYLQTILARAKFIDAKAIIVTAEQHSLILRLGTGQASNPSALLRTSLQLLITNTAQTRSGTGYQLLSSSHLDPARRLASIRSTPDDLALIQFTSGTAGDPKAVALSQRALVTHVSLLQNWLRLYDRFVERGVSWLPFFHDMGLIGFLLTPGYAGGEINLLQLEDFILRPTVWLKALTERRATITGGPPSAFALCAKRVKAADVSQYDLSSVRAALVGAEQVTRESVNAFCEKFRAAGFRSSAMLPTYGLAEASLAVTMPPLETEPIFDSIEAAALADGRAVPREAQDGDPASVRWFASVGAPLPDISIRIVDDRDRDLPERSIGEILIKSPALMNGYLRSPNHAFRDGWLYTGDLGYAADGNLHVTGRKKEVIIVGGRNYYPDDVEQIVSAVPGVRMDRAVAIGVEDSELATERLIVLAETDKAEAAERDALRLSIRRALLATGYPIGEVVLLKPKSIRSTLTGKLKRMDCKARYLTGEFADD